MPECPYHHCEVDTNLYEMGWENFEQAWDIWSGPNSTFSQRWLAGSYMSYWGGAHVAFATGTAIIIREALITLVTEIATKNKDSLIVSIGRYPEYKDLSIAKGFTRFDLGKLYRPLNSLGLAQPANNKFMAVQTRANKIFVGNGILDPTSQYYKEVNWLSNNPNYFEVGNRVWQSLITNLQNSPYASPWWIE